MAAPRTAVPTDLPLSTPDGETTTLATALTHDLTVVQLVRYFGCLPCQEWLVALDQAAGDLADAGIGTASIGGSADYQARWLRTERGVRMPLLLDPDHRFRGAVGADQHLGMRLLNPRGAVAYTRSLRHGFRPQRITRDTVQAPGVVILDAAGAVRWQHVGERIGDYPPVAEVVRNATALR